VDRLDEILLRVSPQWHVRAVIDVLTEEDLGYGSFPKYRDIHTVGDVVRIGAEKLSMRFREVDPAIWEWLIEKLGEVE
jgi:hypothetical protein